MKQFFSATLLFITAVTTLLAADKTPHLGKNNSYPIGDRNIPAKIYVTFLQEKAVHEYLHWWQSSKYYEKAFMTTDQDYFSNRDACIQRTGKSPNFTYSLTPGHDEDIIEAVSSQKVQSEFKQWVEVQLKTSLEKKISIPNGHYFIGNHDVSAKIYLSFLYDKKETVPFWGSPHYYDPAFMSFLELDEFDKVYEKEGPTVFTTAEGEGQKESAIIKCVLVPSERISGTANPYPQTCRTSCYFIVAGHEEDVIDTVSTPEAQMEFNEWYATWLQNPTRGEVCDYINDKLKGRLNSTFEDLAKSIALKYPNACCWRPSRHQCEILGCKMKILLKKEINVGTIFDFANTIVQENSDTIQAAKKDITIQEVSLAILPASLASSFTLNLRSDYENAAIGPVAPNKYDIFPFQSYVITFPETAHDVDSPFPPAVATLNDPKSEWQRDTYDWDLFNARYRVVQ